LTNKKNMKIARWRAAIRSIGIVGGPLCLAFLELFHPHPHDLFKLPLERWLAIHYLQILLFPWSALALVSLLRSRDGVLEIVCRLAAFVFGASYVAFDTAAGVVTGVLVKAAQQTGAPEAWQAPVLTIWNHPVIGGAPGSTPLLAAAGTTAWLLGAAAAAVSVRRAGSSWVPTALLVFSGLGLFVFRTHAWPGGPVTFGCLAAAAACLEWEQSTKAPGKASLA
jgi:hypothetical protein